LKNTVKHIFFDLDHTLWDFDTNSTITLKELYQRFNLSNHISSEEDFVREYKLINEYYWGLYRIDQITKSELRTIRFEKTFEHFGFSDKQLTQEMAEAYVATCPYKRNLMPGCIEILDYLSVKYELHIITNGFQEVQGIKLGESGIANYFTHVISSEEVEKRKPDPIIFNYAASLTGSLGSENLMIGDHFDADVQGALSVGWHAIHYDPNLVSEKQFKNRISDLSELKSWL
jgi:putative hydrolase of the HAD superfamily